MVGMALVLKCAIGAISEKTKARKWSAKLNNEPTKY